MQVNTDQQYDTVADACRNIFIKKTMDYGTSWRVFRTISVADQLYIKARRIRNIQETGVQRVDDDITGEYRGIFNYAIIGLIQLQLADDESEEIEPEKAIQLYDAQVLRARQLMEAKNHDYGEAWREMSDESFADLILVKILRIKQIVQNEGKTIASEGIDANYFDIINYAVFALIQGA